MVEENIFDEFQNFKVELSKLGLEVVKIEKVGNGSMDYHEVFYKSPKFSEIKSVYVDRQNIEDLLQRFKEAYQS